MSVSRAKAFARGKRGMTLFEIIIVIALISLIVAFTVNRLGGVFERNQAKLASMAVRDGFELPLKEFQIDMRRYPTTEEGLIALVKRPENDSGRWRGPYLKEEEMLEDPWGKRLQYRFPGTHNTGSYDLWSLGPDGVESQDDITNW